MGNYPVFFFGMVQHNAVKTFFALGPDINYRNKAREQIQFGYEQQPVSR